MAQRAHRNTPFLLTTAQLGLWFMHRLHPEMNLNVAEALEMEGALDADLLIEACHRVLAETETFRIRLIETPEGPRQIVGETGNGRIVRLDFSAEEDGKAAAWRWLEQDAARRRDLLQDDLYLAALLKTSATHHVFYSNISHILADGYSGMLFARRLADTYAALLAGEQPGEEGGLTVGGARAHARHADARACIAGHDGGTPRRIRREHPGAAPTDEEPLAASGFEVDEKTVQMGAYLAPRAGWWNRSSIFQSRSSPSSRP